MNNNEGKESFKNESNKNGFHIDKFDNSKPSWKPSVDLSGSDNLRTPKRCSKEPTPMRSPKEPTPMRSLKEPTPMRSPKEPNPMRFPKESTLMSSPKETTPMRSPKESTPMGESEIGHRMMEKMGYTPGSGLGKNKQGIIEPLEISSNLGKRGLGLQIEGLDKASKTWDFDQEMIVVEEKIKWLTLNLEEIPNFQKEDFKDWIKEDTPNYNVCENNCFCDAGVLTEVFKAKDIFDELDINELNIARARSNPYETIKSVFFMNRAALKMANIDAACDFMFTHMEKNEAFGQEESPIFFSDVCAGPGGFTEYILWRKKWLYKGFGLTLRDENDFRVSKSSCASAVTFQPLYGKDESGDVCNPENIKDFTEKVKHESEHKGLHFMMSDGGFCVEKQENLQEILSKNIYLCQCLLALNTLREHGCFVTKLFDIFTPFSVGLLYLMHLCFEKVGIIKPNSSRPANSERYFVCSNLRFTHQTSIIRDYLSKVAERLWEIRNQRKKLPKIDILELVPIDVIQKDKRFFDYIYESNKSIAAKQIIALKKLALFCRNPSLEEVRQETLRKACLEYWNIPDTRKKSDEIDTPRRIFGKIKGLKYEVFLHNPRNIFDLEGLSLITCASEWLYCYMHSKLEDNDTTFFAGTDFAKSFYFKSGKWERINNLGLAKDTLLYGEIVGEKSILQDGGEIYRDSLHVIDAIRLGSMDLEKFSFAERQKQIHIYCKAVNKETEQLYAIRVRPKPLIPLNEIPDDFLARSDNGIRLPIRGFQSISDRYQVSSVLLIKANLKAPSSKSSKNSFQSTYMDRLQISITKDQRGVTLQDLKDYVRKLPR